MYKQYHQRHRDRRSKGNLAIHTKTETPLERRINILEEKVAKNEIIIMSLKGQVKFLIDMIKDEIKENGLSISG
jgi:hypothetical protein